MKLSDLVDLRNQLRAWHPDQLNLPVREATSALIYQGSNHPAGLGEATAVLQQRQDQIFQHCSAYADSVTEYVRQLDDLIAQQEPHYLSESYRLYDQFMRREQPDYILNRRLGLSVEARDSWNTKIAKLSDWKYPGLVIRPGREDWPEGMVALDPLYVADLNHDLLAPVRERFNEQYKGRLRFQIINESDEQNLLPDIPREQIGLVCVYNFFNYRPFEMIRRYLDEIYRCLRPGGSLLLTYNNCDLPGGVILAERGFTCYTPRTLIMSVIDTIGYQTVYEQDLDAANTMLELRKPGTLSSLRGGQTLAQINYPPAPPPKPPKPAKPPKPPKPPKPAKGKLTRPVYVEETKPPGTLGLTRPKKLAK
jgi:SAM-dependent methyltransferase